MQWGFGEVMIDDIIIKTEEEKILLLSIEYRNISGAVAAILDELDKKYGKLSYSIKRSGPKCNVEGIDIGLMIVHVDQ